MTKKKSAILDKIANPDLYELDVKDRNVIHKYVNEKFVDKMRNVSSYIWDMDESEQRAAVHISPLEDKLRIAFWQEYEEAVKRDRSMDMRNVYAPLCSASYFYKMLDNPHKCAFILTPPMSAIIERKYIRQLAYRRVKEILEAPILKDGSLDAAAAKVCLEVLRNMDERIDGAVAQRIDQRTLSLQKVQQINEYEKEKLYKLDQEIIEYKKKLGEIEYDGENKGPASVGSTAEETGSGEVQNPAIP
jgi:hypothetical protein